MLESQTQHDGGRCPTTRLSTFLPSTPAWPLGATLSLVSRHLCASCRLCPAAPCTEPERSGGGGRGWKGTQTVDPESVHLFIDGSHSPAVAAEVCPWPSCPTSSAGPSDSRYSECRKHTAAGSMCCSAGATARQTARQGTRAPRRAQQKRQAGAFVSCNRRTNSSGSSPFASPSPKQRSF